MTKKKKPYIDWTQIDMQKENLTDEDCVGTMKAFGVNLYNEDFEAKPYIRNKHGKVSILVANLSKDKMAICKDLGFSSVNRGTIPRSVRRKHWELLKLPEHV